ncbi:hypothetical protein B0H63DRAFT_13287 [Podospora didyma]|uniref:Uncharacterized protein n=1 Tax=Podospora didyma TaxID=330526 RepID=A0AAE0U7E9_9PEZI|nr:hypothetical protein B0H63DRAFT_13287 [Podospora didyma]
MSRLLRRSSGNGPPTPKDDPNSVYLSLLDAENDDNDDDDYYGFNSVPVIQQPPLPHQQHRRAWTSESAKSWASADSTGTGERPPARKLIKEPGNGSARPSFSLELSDTDGEKEKPSGGIVRRKIAKFKSFYRRDKRIELDG